MLPVVTYITSLLIYVIENTLYIVKYDLGIQLFYYEIDSIEI